MAGTASLIIVVLMHNQAANLAACLHAYEAQVSPGLFVFVLDRCADDTRSILEDFRETSRAPVMLVDSDSDSGFQAGANRDAGLRAAESVLPGCHVLFMDGDCIPSPDLFRNTEAVLDLNSSLPVAACGRRINTTESGSHIEDNRIRAFVYSGKVFTPGVNRIVASRDVIRSRMITWSCCLGLNRAAINALRAINQKLDGANRVFNPAFDGTWGGEDDFIGVSLAAFGGALVALDPKNFVTHIWHPKRENSDYRTTAYAKTRELMDMAAAVHAPGVLRLTTSGDDVVVQAMSCTSMTAPPMLSKFVDTTGITGFQRVGVINALCVHTAIEESGETVQPTPEQRVVWESLREVLGRITHTPWAAEEFLPAAVYGYNFDTMCS